ncbi:MAG: ParA family protein [Leptolyngbyaceae cyanobacterium bins.59]|nr:ParA family protein [Leptolyngbyaceae cyanobacterium bins.59]
MSKVAAKSAVLSPQYTHLSQIILWVGANAGGVGKTTLAVHVGYEMARRGFDVALLDLDTNGSISLFCGLEHDPKPEETTAAVLSENFSGNWPLVTPRWGKPKGVLQICQGGPVLSYIAEDLMSQPRREFVLADRLKKYPLPHQLIILDCPAMLGMLTNAALVASTYMLIPVQLTYKSVKGASGLLSWRQAICQKLKLNPAPKILGVIPTQYDGTEAAQRTIVSDLPDQLGQLQIKCYDYIRYSSEFNNAIGRGMPLHVYRPGHSACQDFLPICNDLTNLLT